MYGPRVEDVSLHDPDHANSAGPVGVGGLPCIEVVVGLVAISGITQPSPLGAGQYVEDEGRGHCVKR